MIRYNYDEMHKKASELRAILPDLLLQEKWQDIAEAVKISPDIWSGKAADVYSELSQKIVNNMDVERIKKIPDVIDNSAAEMRKRELRLVDINSSFV